MLVSLGNLNFVYFKWERHVLFEEIQGIQYVVNASCACSAVTFILGVLENVMGTKINFVILKSCESELSIHMDVLQTFI